MTPPINAELETLIVRSLDGETSADEELELNKTLLRSREAREIMDAYRRNDALAAGAMQAALGIRRADEAGSPKPSPVRTIPWWAAHWALAASVLLAVGLGLSVVFLRVPGEPGAATEQPLRTVERYGPQNDVPPGRDPWLIQAGTPYEPEVPHQRSRQIDRDYIIIQDGHQADRYYLLERNRTRSVIVPAAADL